MRQEIPGEGPFHDHSHPVGGGVSHSASRPVNRASTSVSRSAPLAPRSPARKMLKRANHAYQCPGTARVVIASPAVNIAESTAASAYQRSERQPGGKALEL